MLIGDPLGEGSNASSTNSELWGAEKLILQNERELRRPEGSGMLIWRFSTAWYGTVRYGSLLGGFPLGTVPGT